jgi:hemerythrin superfamily protein
MAEEALDAIALLKADHREVEELFAKSDKESPGTTAKRDLVKKICQALTVHAQIEEEIAYPAFRQAGVTSRIMDEAAVEHAKVKQLVEELEDSNASDDQDDAKVKELSDYVKHHVKEEENEMFPEVKDTDADIERIGDQLMKRKRELMTNTKERPAA